MGMVNGKSWTFCYPLVCASRWSQIAIFREVKCYVLALIAKNFKYTLESTRNTDVHQHMQEETMMTPACSSLLLNPISYSTFIGRCKKDLCFGTLRWEYRTHTVPYRNHFMYWFPCSRYYRRHLHLQLNLLKWLHERKNIRLNILLTWSKLALLSLFLNLMGGHVITLF